MKEGGILFFDLSLDRIRPTSVHGSKKVGAGTAAQEAEASERPNL